MRLPRFDTGKIDVGLSQPLKPGLIDRIKSRLRLAKRRPRCEPERDGVDE